MTAAPGARFSDLLPRVLSGLVLAGAGLAAVLAGGVAFLLVVALASGAMLWELARMQAPGIGARALIFPAAGGASVMALATGAMGPGAFVLLAAGTAALGAAFVARVRRVDFALAAAAILIGGYALVMLRDGLGAPWVLWLVLTVAASDIAGYFIGKAVGGPKLWPRISPNKTWSGTVAGWAGAAAVGLGMAGVLGTGALGLALASVALAIAGQASDIGESALKRRAGVKDSSALIPGHGGVMDRFDALVGASVAALALALSGLAAG